MDKRQRITKINILLIIIKYKKQNLIEIASLKQMNRIMSS